ncbi:WD40/YVTN/BNR-like repeat-containing protein [Inhella sp.]|uniref:WD40/YVTN/BNR-like repeat-containing protein n=1 Tax=Inhella sp. TaxID=1921806 RepID=UPI0035AFE198
MLKSDGSIWRSEDGGRSWQALTQAGELLHSQDGGQQWDKARAEGALERARVRFDRLGRGLLFSTQDGGQTWQLQQSGSERRLATLFALDAKTVWIAGGAPETLLSTATGGR